MAEDKVLDYNGLAHFKGQLDVNFAKVIDLDRLIKRVEALERLHAGGNDVAPVNPPKPDPPINTFDNSDYPMISNGVDFYPFTTEQGIKLNTLIAEARGSLSKINDVLLKTKLGQELGIKGITSIETFYASKGYQITSDALKTFSDTPYRAEIQEYLKEAGY